LYFYFSRKGLWIGDGGGDSLHGHKARDEELGTGDKEQPRVAMKDEK
jgi:hypothetical protein